MDWFEASDAIDTVMALGNLTRLKVFRLLVRSGPDGLIAGDIARAVGGPQNTMSPHLAILTRAGLIRRQRRSRTIVYQANPARVRDLMLFLEEDCGGGKMVRL